jgi:hypothetical protein
MKRLIALFACTFAFSLMLQAQHAHAADPLDTGNDFLLQCDEARLNKSNAVSVAQYMRYAGYIQGFLEGHTVLIAVSGAKPSYCYPENVGTEQVRRIVTKSLKDHPEKTHLPISVLMEKALVDAFPCDK